MTALARQVDPGFDRKVDLYAEWTIGGTTLSVSYRLTVHVHYASPRHMHYGIDPCIEVTKIERELHGSWVPAQLDPAQREALIARIETDEVCHAPLSGE